jgi:proteic killer suppression protein
MIRSFADRGTADVWDGVDSKAARRVCPAGLWPRARRKLDDLNQVRHYSDLKTPPGNQLHPLHRDRADQWAIAINDQYRICFRWHGNDAFEVEITDYH